MQYCARRHTADYCMGSAESAGCENNACQFHFVTILEPSGTLRLAECLTIRHEV